MKTFALNLLFCCFAGKHFCIKLSKQPNSQHFDFLAILLGGSNARPSDMSVSTGENTTAILLPEQSSSELCLIADDEASMLDCFLSEFRFTVNVADLQSDCVESSAVILRDVSWRVKLCKRQIETKNVLDVFLVLALDAADKWSCEAQATFALHQKDNQKDKVVSKALNKHKFSDLSSSFGIEEFIDWETFMAEHVKENKATFDIEITANPSQRIVPSKMVQLYTRLHIFVENVSKLGETFSSEVTVQGIKWRVHVAKKNDKLAVNLLAAENDIDLYWGYRGDMKFELSSYDGQPLTKRIDHDFSWASPEGGFDEFLSWNDFVDSKNKYVLNDNANFLVEFKVDKPKSLIGIVDESKPAIEQVSTNEITLDCAICMESFGSGRIFSTKCGHLFCRNCYTQATSYSSACPLCKETCYQRDLHPLYFQE